MTLAEKIRQLQDEGYFESSSRKEEGVLDRSEHSVSGLPIQNPVGTVGTVGTPSLVNALVKVTGRNSGRDRSGHPLTFPADRAAADPVPRPARLPASDPLVQGVARLQRMRPLVGFTAYRWRLVQLGCSTLLRSHGHVLAQLGWSATDAFGIHPTAPGAAVHCYGLGPLLSHGDVVAMTEAGATMRCRDGVLQSYTRRPMPDAIPIWDCRRFG